MQRVQSKDNNTQRHFEEEEEDDEMIRVQSHDSVSVCGSSRRRRIEKRAANTFGTSFGNKPITGLLKNRGFAATRENPWLNKKVDVNSPPPDDASTRAQFMETLRHGLPGGRLADLSQGEAPNLYAAFGFASQGYGDWENVQTALQEWCKRNDARHPKTGWILLMQGDGDYGKKSIESVAQCVCGRGTPVVFIQSDFGYAEPGSAYWPTYASAGYFGAGLRHNRPKLGKDGEPRLNKDGSVMLQEAWGGFVKDEHGNSTGQLAFPDAAVLEQEFAGKSLKAHLGGIFIAGGGEITFEQAQIYQLGAVGRDGDVFVPAITVDGVESRLNSVYNALQCSAEAALKTVKLKMAIDRCVRVMMADPDTTRPTIVFLHGLDSSSQTWDATVGALGAAGYPAVAMDLRGHGESPLGEEKDFTTQSVACDVLEAVQTEKIPKPFVLCGHSMGARVALEVAAIDAARIQAGDERCLAALIVEDMDMNISNEKWEIADAEELRAMEHSRRHFATSEAAVEAILPWVSWAESFVGTRIRELPDGTWWSDLNPMAKRLAVENILKSTDGAEAWEKLATSHDLAVHVWCADPEYTVCKADGTGGLSWMKEKMPHAEFLEFTGSKHAIHNKAAKAFQENLMALVDRHLR